MKILLLFTLLFMACRPQTPPEVRPARQVRVALEDGTDGTGWFQSHRDALSSLWPRLDSTGYRFVVDQRNPDVSVRTFDARGCQRSAGEYLLGSRFVVVDPACVQGDEVLRFAVMHELLHWLTWRDHRWAGHLCKQPEATTDCHPSVFGVGVLSPVLGEMEEGFGADPTFVSAEITKDDLRLLSVLRQRRGD